MIAGVIFIATLLVLVWRPWRLGLGWIALGGALTAWLAGVISPADVPLVWRIIWDATFTLVALIVLSLVLDACGFFEWCALHVARWGGGQGHRLFVWLILLAAVLSALFANDGAVLILTPLTLEMLRALRWPPRAVVALTMAIGFVVDSASLPLMTSNLTNIITANYFEISFRDYAMVMLPVNLVAVAASLAVLWWVYRRDVPTQFDPGALAEPASVIRDHTLFRAGWWVLGGLLVGYWVAHPLGWPVSAVTGSAALVLLGLAWREHWLPQQPQAVISVRLLLREAPWNVVVFSLGMYLVVFGLRNQGLTGDLARLLEYFAGLGTTPATLATGVLIAGMSAVMNNLPTVMIGCLAIGEAHLTPTMREALIYANIVGANLGPKMTPLGSLATLLWLHVLAQRGVHIGWRTYCTTGLLLTLPVLLATLLGLIVWLGLR